MDNPRPTFAGSWLWIVLLVLGALEFLVLNPGTAIWLNQAGYMWGMMLLR